jgi:hypothetical protein
MARLPTLLLLPFLARGAALTLHVKAGPDGRANGDCPFAHALRMAIEHKGLEYTLAPHAPDAKPNWLVREHGGSMPCLVDGDSVRHPRSNQRPHAHVHSPADPRLRAAMISLHAASV